MSLSTVPQGPKTDLISFKPGAAVRIKNTEVLATVIGTDETSGRITLLYFDDNGVAHDLFLPPGTLILIDQDGK